MDISGSPTIYPPSSPSDELDLMTVEEVATRLKVDESTVYRIIQRGEMRCVHFGKSVRVMRQDLAEFIEQNRGY